MAVLGLAAVLGFSLVVASGYFISVASLVAEQELCERRLVVAVHGLSFLRGTGDLPGPRTEPMSPALQADSYPLGHQGSPRLLLCWGICYSCSNNGSCGLIPQFLALSIFVLPAVEATVFLAGSPGFCWR